ncbi:MAG TPA: protein translocase subunit SecD [Patescibacteria group bacterium]
MSTSYYRLFFIVLLTAVAAAIALPKELPIKFEWRQFKIDRVIGSPGNFELKQGLDIQGGMQVVLAADMSEIPVEDRERALESAREIMLRRVDLFGISEPVVQTSQQGDQHRIIVELPGIDDPAQALQLLGTTAQLSFRLQSQETSPEATESAMAFFNSFQEVGIGGDQLRRATVQFDPQTGEPVIGLEFNEEGTEKFAQVTTDHTGETLAIFLDDFPVTMPVIQTPILNGQAQISGGFTVEQAQQLAIQLNAGALPVPIEVIEQRTIGASLGQESVRDSLRAGVIGIGLVMTFMIAYYGLKGFLASLALVVYAVLTVATYKILGVTLTLPGLAGLLLSIGMAVDANILIFERMKEELLLDKPFERAMELGFGRAWDSIKDANIATIMTALVLINPLDFSFLNTSGLVRGFGVTLLIGVLISLFTGVVVTRTFMRIFLASGKKV